MLYVALIDNQSVAINMLKMNLITLSLWLESTKGNRFFSEYECVINNGLFYQMRRFTHQAPAKNDYPSAGKDGRITHSLIFIIS